MSYIPGFGYNGISTISAGDQRILYPSINKIFPYWKKKFDEDHQSDQLKTLF